MEALIPGGEVSGRVLTTGGGFIGSYLAVPGEALACSGNAVWRAGVRARAGVTFAVIAGSIPQRRLLTHHDALSELDAAFEAMEARADGVVKAIVVP